MSMDDRQRSIHLELARMSESPKHPTHSIATGFVALDRALGAGLPRGHLVEIAGPAGSGKTTLLLQTAAHLQRDGLTAAWIDADHTFDAAWAAKLGADTARMPLAQPESAEQALEIARTLAQSGAVDLLVIDSAAALVPQLEKTLGIGSAPGLHSRVLGPGLRKLNATAARSGVCVVFLNQLRNRAAASGGGEISAGGAPLKLIASVRLLIERAGGPRVRIRIVKNSAATGVSGGELEWRANAGFAESP
jgi:recombination protein RecA